MKQILTLHFNILKHFYRRSIKIISFEKKNFYFYVAAGIFNTAGNILILYTAFSKVPLVNGWNFYNVISLYATYRLTRGFYGFLIGANLKNFYQTIRQGNLDLLLIKPASAWFLLSFQQTDFSRLADLLTGFGILLYALPHLHSSFFTILFFICFIPLALILITCTYIIVSLTAFFNIRDTILSFIEKLMNTTTRFPLRFANNTIQFILTWLMPFMFLATIPIEVLENRINIPLAFISASLLAALYILLARLLWQKCLQRYSSASS